VHRGTGWIGLVACAGALLAGCTAPAVAAPPAPPAQHAAPAPAPAVTTEPADGSTAVAPAAPVTVKAANGRLTGVTLTGPGGVTVPGALSADGATWTASAPPKFDTEYTFAGTVTGAGGTKPVTGSFTTADPRRYLTASTTIADGSQVGVAAPIIVQFNRTVPASGRAAVERALSVTTSVPVTGSWAWLPDSAQGSRVHWRPQHYWPENTQVTMAAHLYGVDAGNGLFGRTDLTSTFSIGRSQIVKADARSHRIQVVRDGQVVMDLPASYGADSDPRRITRSGVHVVMGKTAVQLMTNPDFGYTDIPEKWAVRISNNGEFIHANPASSSAQGKRNVTHGCINLSTKNAKQYYDTAMFGDPVEITGTSVALSSADGDLYDWAVPWEKWTAMSALH
jgi:lipoprotein-anchoring transpeptidase ErfK/SrfK